MEHTSLFWLSICSALALPACSAAGEIADDSDGMVELSLSDAPADARCLEVSFDGAKDLKRKLPLTPGAPSSFLLDCLPVGLSNVDARAFSVVCDSVASTAVPSYVLESPVTVRIKPIEPTRIVLSLIQSGRLGVDVEFEEGLAGDLEPIELALIGDTPYGAAQLEAFPTLVNSINAAGVRAIIHVGDIKNGSTRCDTPTSRESTVISPLQRAARLHPRRQRVDGLPPRQQRRLRPARATRRPALDLLPGGGRHSGRAEDSAQPGVRAGARPLRRKSALVRVRHRLLHRARRRQQQRLRHLVRHGHHGHPLR